MLLAQDGYARSEKIKKGLQKDIIDGAIFCPCYSSPNNFESDVTEYLESFPEKDFFMDTHFYVSLMSANKIGRLAEYSFFDENLTERDFSVRNIPKFIARNIDYQYNLNFQNILSPGILIDSFNSKNSQLSLQLFKESEEYFISTSDNKNLYLSLIILENSLLEEENINEFLDEITRLNVKGYYIIVQRNLGDYPQWKDPLLLARLLYMINSLSQNDYDVLIGYTDLVGILVNVAGAKGFGNGWWLNLKQFTRDRFIQRTPGGRPPKATYISNKLLNSININPDLLSINEISRLNHVLSTTSFDEILEKNSSDEWESFWDKESEVLQYWEAINLLINEIDVLESMEEKINFVINRIDSASALYIELENEGVTFVNKGKKNHLAIWKESLRIFQDMI